MDLFGLMFFLLAATIISWFIRPRYLFGIMITFDLLFGAWEFLSMKQSGESVSTNVQIFDMSNPMLVTAFCVSFIGIGVFLFIHFKAKRWFQK